MSARAFPGTRKFFIKPVLAPLGEIAPKHIIEVDIDEYIEVCEQTTPRRAINAPLPRSRTRRAKP